MYYGELCIKVSKEDNKSILKFFTRKRKNRVLPEGEEVSVGDCITLEVGDEDTVKTILLDMYAIVSKGVCTRERTGDKSSLWRCKPGVHVSVLSGPVILDIVSKNNFADIGVTLYKEDSMDGTNLGSIRFTDTGDNSLMQKILAALNNIGVAASEAHEYRNMINKEQA